MVTFHFHSSTLQETETMRSSQSGQTVRPANLGWDRDEASGTQSPPLVTCSRPTLQSEDDDGGEQQLPDTSDPAKAN